jgi:hypothetical protein
VYRLAELLLPLLLPLLTNTIYSVITICRILAKYFQTTLHCLNRHNANFSYYVAMQWGALINKLLSGWRHLSQWRKKGRQLGTKKKIAIISAYGHTKLKLTFFMLLGGPQNTIKSHLVFTALFCFAPFSVFFSRMSAPYSRLPTWIA